MKTTVSVSASTFIDEIVGHEYNDITREGVQAIYEYLVELEQDCGVEIEMDGRVIRGTYSEYANIEAVMDEYECISSLSDLKEYTQVIEIPNTNRLIVAHF